MALALLDIDPFPDPYITKYCLKPNRISYFLIQDPPIDFGEVFHLLSTELDPIFCRNVKCHLHEGKIDNI